MRHNKKLSNKNVIFTFLTAILFCGTIFSSVSGTYLPIIDLDCDFSTETIIYVDDDNTEGPWDGTLEHPYQYIKDGIDAAYDGYTVYVFSGIYSNTPERPRNIAYINKSIDLIGEDRNSTEIKLPYPLDWMVKIVADYVNVSGFCFRVVGEVCIPSKILIDTASHCMIMENRFVDPGNVLSRSDFRIIDSQYIMISDNIIGEYQMITVKDTQGIYLSNSQNIKICNNTFDRYEYGIDGFQVTNCIIVDNQFYTTGGIRLNLSSGNIISRNSIDSGVNNYGLLLLESSDNTIVCNSFMSNKIRSRKASFIDCLNTWDGNYWGRMRLFPKVIFGKRTLNGLSVPAFQIDWHPAATYEHALFR